MKTLKILAIFLCLASTSSLALPLTIGQTPPETKLAGDLGGRVSGEPWSSAELSKSGKVTSIFYVDPEEKKLNEPIEQAYEKEKFPFEQHASIAIINMAAAWYPNSMISSMLKQKQEKYPRTIYIKDMRKTLVSAWDLQDDSVNLIVFDKAGKVLYVKKGKMSPEETSELIKLIRANL